MSWHFVLAQADGTAVGELTEAKGKKAIWKLGDAATAQFTLDTALEQAALIEELEMDLIVYDDDGEAWFRGRLGSSSDEFGPTGDAGSFSAVDYRGFLARRILWPGSTASFAAEEQIDILWTLIADSQGTDGGDLGITRGIRVPTGVVRTFTFDEGTGIDQIAGQIADVDNGFEWEIDALLRFNTFFPQRGADTAVVLDYKGSVVSGSRALDTGKFANAIRYSGDSSLTPVTAEAASFGSAGRWELQVGDTSILDQPTLTLKADFELAQDEVPNPSYQLKLRRGWWSPEVLWLGDSAEVVVFSGRLQVDVQQRVSQVEVDIDDDSDSEVVTITTGPIPNADILEVNSVLQRLAHLERT